MVHSSDELLQTRNRLPKEYASHAMMMLEGKQYSFFVLCTETMIFVIVVNEEWKRGGICQLFCHGHAA